MRNYIRHIPLTKLVPHPDNANRMSRTTFSKLLRHIERTGCYEPLVVRRHPDRPGFFQIINGAHRCEALRKLGHHQAEAVVWDVDDEQTDLLLATLNRLQGRDTLDKKLALLRRLGARVPLGALARFLPHTRGQLERLTGRRSLARPAPCPVDAFPTPLVFFVDEAQKEAIEDAVVRVAADLPTAGTRAGRRATALLTIVQFFLDCDRLAAAANEPPSVPSAPPARAD
ncbi:MAG: ParB/RepB/Spo0J family partition protein [Planctomycetes bacterium]|jgi:hypothetical protein|nr:ParB/RepB/Spo0J family partition protein [Planctomycetota bacterium]